MTFPKQLLPAIAFVLLTAGLLLVPRLTLKDNPREILVTAATTPVGVTAPLGKPVPREKVSEIPDALTTPTQTVEKTIVLDASTKAILPNLNAGQENWRQYNPDRQRLVLDKNVTVDVERFSTYEQADRLVWVGRNKEQGITYVSVASKDHLEGVMTIPGLDNYEVSITNSKSSSRAVAPQGPVCAEASIERPTETAETSASEVEVAHAVSFVDVAFFYDPGVLTAAGSADTIQSKVMARLESANQYLIQSQVTNFQWNFVGLFPVYPYATTGDINNDISIFSGTQGATPTSIDAFAKAATVGADQLVLLFSGTRNYAGIAYLPGRHAVVTYNDSSGSILAHELAHNFRCRHDRVTEGAPDNNGAYNYGHTMTVVETIGGQPYTSTWGTIMSYYGQIAPYYSNPNVNYKGVPTGIAIGEAKAAFNAQTLIENAASVATYATPPSIPVIISQPTSLTATTGALVSFRVTATGNALTYQWYKDNALIPLATSSTYSKVSVATDAGSYTVVVTNTLGSATSTPATLTLNAPINNSPAPAPSSPPDSGSNGSSSGGGGGAPSHGFLAALATLGALRMIFRKRMA